MPMDSCSLSRMGYRPRNMQANNSIMDELEHLTLKYWLTSQAYEVRPGARDMTTVVGIDNLTGILDGISSLRPLARRASKLLDNVIHMD